jgi:hypothetical protein
LCPELLDVFELHRVPLAGVWTVVDVDGTHVNVFLVPTGPDAPNFKIKLRERAAGDLLVEVTQEVKLLLEADKSAVNFFVNFVEQKAI